jgi:hypothetical protein
VSVLKRAEAFLNAIHAFLNAMHAFLNAIHAFLNAMPAFLDAMYALMNAKYAFLNANQRLYAPYRRFNCVKYASSERFRAHAADIDHSADRTRKF